MGAAIRSGDGETAALTVARRWLTSASVTGAGVGTAGSGEGSLLLIPRLPTSTTRNTRAAKRFLDKALRGCKEWELPEVVNTDKAPTYAAAIAELKAEGKCPKDTKHRQVKYLNNVVEADHGKLKQLIRPVRGFKSMKTAYATIKGFEVMRALRKG